MNARTPATGRRRLVAAAFAGPAAAWFAHLLVAYLLVPVACDAGSRLVLHLLSAGAVAISVATLLVALRAVRRDPHSGDRGETLVLAQGAMFLLALLAGWLAIGLVEPCS